MLNDSRDRQAANSSILSRVLRLHECVIELFKDRSPVYRYDQQGRNTVHRVLVDDTDRLVLHVLKRDKNVLHELLTTNESFVQFSDIKAYVTAAAKNPEKSKKLLEAEGFVGPYYNLTIDQWRAEQPLTLPASQRAGILTQPSWLIAHSNNVDNQPIQRGKWIYEHLLGGTIPDTPITVDAKLPEEPHNSLRERMRFTREAYCWTCHQRMNPIGLTFEMYNGHGQFRTEELVTVKQRRSKANRTGPLWDCRSTLRAQCTPERRRGRGRRSRQCDRTGASPGQVRARSPGIRSPCVPVLDGAQRIARRCADLASGLSGLQGQRRQHERLDFVAADVRFVPVSTAARQAAQAREIAMTFNLRADFDRRAFLKNIAIGAAGGMALSPLARRICWRIRRQLNLPLGRSGSSSSSRIGDFTRFTVARQVFAFAMAVTAAASLASSTTRLPRASIGSWTSLSRRMNFPNRLRRWLRSRAR